MTRQRLAGVAFILLPVLLAWLAVAIYDKKFVDVAMVTLRTGTAGSEMHPHTDVKMRGVVVGEVREIHSDGAGATLKLALKPELVRMIPANVSAQMLPTTLFGQRFVLLIPPAQPSAQRLTEGSHISQDRSVNAIELQEVLDNLLPLLTAVQPAKLSATLSAVAQALDGRGAKLGKLMVDLDTYLKKVNPSLPALNRAIKELVAFTQNFGQAIPDVIDALRDFTFTSKTIAGQKTELSRMYAAVTESSQDLTDFLRENSNNIIRLAEHSKPSLKLFAKYSPEYPCTLGMLADFVPMMDKVLGKGTRHPGLHVNVQTVPSKGPYVPGKDKPVYRRGGSPNCYPVPYTPGSKSTVARGGLGLQNSPQEVSLVNELLAPGLQEVPSALPDWSSVLVGPIYRGTEVEVR